MTLTFGLDLDILPLDLHAKIQVLMSVRSAVRVVTDTHTMSQLLHPSLTQGVIRQTLHVYNWMQSTLTNIVLLLICY